MQSTLLYTAQCITGPKMSQCVGFCLHTQQKFRVLRAEVQSVDKNFKDMAI